ncbi:heat shock 70 kDa protein 12A-like [Mya arenaria]|nr:heat shock 70 kDa protein 12A-like [Mya arenaria]XP_052816704.1 heat shock 70 kDa protein 12A-like [Mya arenaria]XP_052816705.1 heat shock 70 kDa protein 12A-like [Mya arenaria]XP_052816706.1 heat shock 70 kDa protein 12A-like [Mya arenaria]XP_052816707.1 heat shock 70 kDa protein 12A-like [Mya arenaria]
MSRKDVLLVAALDFGTAYSGYAIQFRHEYDPKDPTKIRAPQPWNGGKQSLMSYKTPTCLLLDDNQTIVSFGFEAEERYADICMSEESHKYYFFRRFKMRLQEGEGLKKDATLADETDRELPALTVFALSIQCLRNRLMELLNNEGTGPGEDEVLWVLTVPAIWDDRAKEFMKAAAKQAGINEKFLQIALEPEVASLFCQYLPVEKLCDTQKNAFSNARPGTIYMVADLGGGTADITVHEKLADNKVKEVHQATGGPWGGTAVDHAFWQLLVAIVGNPTMSRFRREQTYDHLELLKEFECVKRTLGSKEGEWYTIKLPASLNDACKEDHEETFKELAEQSLYKDNLTFIGDKMRVKVSLVEILFKKVTDQIIQHINNIILKSDVGKKVSLILMVGGFSESPFVQKQMKGAFSKHSIKVLIPQQAGLAVLNGAVIFGRAPEAITTRVLRCSYGVKCGMDFREGVDPEDLRSKTDQKKCQDRYDPFIKEGTSVERGHKVVKLYKTTAPHQPEMAVHVYTASGRVPEYVSDPDCRLFGTLRVKVPNPSDKIRKLLVIFRFGSTSLAMLAVEEESKRACVTAFSLQE